MKNKCIGRWTFERASHDTLLKVMEKELRIRVITKVNYNALLAEISRGIEVKRERKPRQNKLFLNKKANNLFYF
jgi:hypothetical protein